MTTKLTLGASVQRAHARSDDVGSPCVRICRLVGPAWARYCSGCGRSVEEIAAWTRLSDQEKRNIWNRLLVT